MLRRAFGNLAGHRSVGLGEAALALLLGLSLVALGCEREGPRRAELGTAAERTAEAKGRSTPAPTSDAPPRVLTVVATDYRYEPGVLAVRPEETVTLVLHNRGTHRHNLEVSVAGQVHSLLQDVPPGATGTVTFTLPDRTGDFEFFCPVDGHHELGMQGMLHVAREPPPPPVSNR